MELNLTSIQEPPPLPPVTLETLRAQIQLLEDAHKEKGTPLSGRIIHVCHQLPVIVKHLVPTSPTSPTALKDSAAPSSLPASLASAASTVASTIAAPFASSSSSASTKWSITPRRGHTAMISGIRSLAQTHEQVVVAWTGVQPDHDGATDEEEFSDEDKLALEQQLKGYKSEEDTVEDGKHVEEGEKPEKAMQYVPVWLTQAVAKGHYEGFCKTTLWPLFHYLLWQDVASEYPLDDPDYRAYVSANKTFAERVASVYQPGDLIFVHDYHLLLAPKMLRELLPEANIAMFFHAPFPSSEIFRCLPRRKEILEGMLGSNLVCFQTYSYSRHFLSTCIRVCGFESTPAGVDAHGAVTAIAYCPIGIDADRVTLDVNRPEVGPKIEALRQLYRGKKIIVGREKLDVSKGVLEKLEAFEKLLETRPEWRGKVVLIQVTQPALSESVKLERQVSELVSHINGLYGSLDFIPVHHYHQTIDREEYFALLSVADLAVITALRDGMNTTSMEFTLCQAFTNHSPLVLSEFMGTSAQFSSALLINPHDVLGVADAIHRGLTMSDEEKRERHTSLFRSVKEHTSGTWAASIVKMLLENVGGDHMAHQTPFLEKSLLKEKYDGAKKRLMLFDYDGTLTPIVKVPSQAVPTPLTRETILKLTEDPKNLVYLISGRDGDFLEEHWGNVKLLGLSAEHGCFVRPPGADGWKSLTDALDMSWMSEVDEIFKYYTERTSGSFIENKKASITWHYRASDPDFGSFQCKQCHDLLESTVAPRRPIEVLVGKKNLEVRPLAINKGEIVKKLLYEHPDADFVFCAGDDKTDEDMFRSLRTVIPSTTVPDSPVMMSAPIAITSTVSPAEAEALKDVEIMLKPEGVFTTAVGPSAKKTLARWHVTDPEQVVEMMAELVK